jgi:putative transposase
MHSRAPRQLSLPMPQTWGGRRRRAGRKASTDRPGPPHETRPSHNRRHPVHVTLRARRGIPSLRGDRAFAALRRSLKAATKESFRILHFSVQTDHVHLIVEGDERVALIRGIQGLAIRCARAINRAFGRRGSVWSHRYHARALRTPRETRHGLVYVLLNLRKHLGAGPGIDPRSSAAWFDGWKQPVAVPAEDCPVSQPHTWLGAGGWQRGGGLIDLRENPSPSQ